MGGIVLTDDNISIDLYLGICVRTVAGRVLQQNQICKNLCGDQHGIICRGGCTKFLTAVSEGEREFLESVSMRLVRNIHEDKSVCDAVVIKFPDRIITVLYPKERQIEDELKLFDGYGLTLAEKAILLMVLDGVPNTKIAKKLHISLSTVKKHLNNLYKKLPADFKKRISLERK